MAEIDLLSSIVSDKYPAILEKDVPLLTASLLQIVLTEKTDLRIMGSLFTLLPEICSFGEKSFQLLAAGIQKIKEIIDQYINHTIDPGDTLWGIANNGIWTLSILVSKSLAVAAPGDLLFSKLLQVFDKSKKGAKAQLSQTSALCLGICLQKIPGIGFGGTPEEEKVLGEMTAEILAMPKSEETGLAAQ